ncbi:hypothetical protein Ndes2526B_g04788 [Nannochloris sp. 'desiccata']|nr:putative PRKR-interacting protein 1-like protein [Chlorella desiccata (nom. nud.)]
MALQPYADPGHTLALYQAEQITPEEQERRKQEAEELDKKLRHIVEDVPDRVYHVMGSNAGAGSGEFHTYRHSRRREQERLKQIDGDAERQEKEKERLERLAQLENADEEKTAKRRAKRQKKKDNKRGKRQKNDEGGGAALSGGRGDAGHPQSDGREGEEEEPALPQPDLD